MSDKKLTKEQKKRYEEAIENFREIQEKISRFTKPRQTINISTAGQWINQTEIEREGSCMNPMPPKTFQEAVRPFIPLPEKEELES